MNVTIYAHVTIADNDNFLIFNFTVLRKLTIT